MTQNKTPWGLWSPVFLLFAGLEDPDKGQQSADKESEEHPGQAL